MLAPPSPFYSNGRSGSYYVVMLVLYSINFPRTVSSGEGMLAVGTHDGRVRLVHEATGKVRWEVQGLVRDEEDGDERGTPVTRVS